MEISGTDSITALCCGKGFKIKVGIGMEIPNASAFIRNLISESVLPLDRLRLSTGSSSKRVLTTISEKR